MCYVRQTNSKVLKKLDKQSLVENEVDVDRTADSPGRVETNSVTSSGNSSTNTAVSELDAQYNSTTSVVNTLQVTSDVKFKLVENS